MRLFEAKRCLPLLLLLLRATAFASDIAFEFGTSVVPAGYSIPSSGNYIKVGTAADFTVSGYTVTATAFNYLNTGYELTVDNNAIQERGLGVLSDYESKGTTREINSKEAVMLDFGKILAAGGRVASIRVGSLQSYSKATNDFEGFILYAYKSVAPTDFASATAGTVVYTSTYADTQTNESVTVDLSAYSNYRYFVVQGNPANDIASSNDVALDAATIGVPSLDVTCQTNTTATVGVPFSSGPMVVSGGSAPYTFSIGSGTLPAGLTLDTTTGAITGTATATGTFTVAVVDSVGNFGTACPITVSAAPISVTCQTLTTATVGVPFNSGPMVVTGGVPSYTFSIGSGILPAGLSLDTGTGAVTGTATATGTFTVKVTDSASNVGSSTCPITVGAAPISVTCQANTTAVVGVPFSSGPMAVTGGIPGYTFSLGSGTLPAGLSLNTTTGAVTGTPTATGTFTVKVVDSVGNVGTSCSITVNAAISVTCQANTTAVVGVPFSSGPMGVTGGIPGYTFSLGSGTLPAGLSLNTTTGAVTGTPTATGTFTVKVVDSVGNVGTSCSITVNAAISVTCQANTTAVVGVPFSSGPMAVTGGIPGYTFSLGSGTLPAGLSLNTSTGAVTGTPTATGTFTVKVVDSVGNVGTSCSITVNASISVTCQANTTAVVGVPFSSGPMAVTGGIPGYTFSLGSGTLPAGLSLNTSTGAVTGTPTATGTFTVKVVDSVGNVGTSCSITVNAAISVTCQANTTAVVGVPFSSGPMAVTGGIPGYTFSLGSGTLPAGLSLNTTTGAVTGTPTATGTFTVKVVDSVGNVGTSCSITVNAAISVTCQANTTAVVGVPFSSGPMAVTGGIPGYTFSLGSGTLPAGLSLNTTTGAVTGTPTTTGTFTVKVVDSVGNVGTSCSITVNPAISVTCQANTTAVVGAPFSSGPMAVTGGIPGYTFSLGSGTLPAGLSLNTTTGAVTGTPTAAGTFTVKVTDSAGNVGSACSIIASVDSPVVNTCQSLNTAVMGVTYNSGPMNVTGGLAPYTFSVGSGMLPTGLTLNTTNGAVSGMPATTGTFSLKVTDFAGNSGTSCNMAVNSALASVCQAVSIAPVGLPYNSGPVLVTGGIPPYTFSVGNGSIPAGLMLDPNTGAISGTPTDSGPFIFTVKVTDAVGNVGPSCSFTVDPIDAPGVYQLRYFANLDKGDSYVDISNAGTLNGFDPAGRICVNAYTFDPAEELISCCSCPVTPNGLNTLSVRNDLISNTLTPGVPTSVTVKLVATVPGAGGSCNAAAVNGQMLVRGMRAWATTLHLNSSGSPAVGYQATETQFARAELSPTELTKLVGFCGFIQANGSGFGICKSCRTGALGGNQK